MIPTRDVHDGIAFRVGNVTRVWPYIASAMRRDSHGWLTSATHGLNFSRHPVAGRNLRRWRGARQQLPCVLPIAPHFIRAVHSNGENGHCGFGRSVSIRGALPGTAPESIPTFGGYQDPIRKQARRHLWNRLKWIPQVAL